MQVLRISNVTPTHIVPSVLMHDDAQHTMQSRGAVWPRLSAHTNYPATHTEKYVRAHALPNACPVNSILEYP